MIRLCAIAVGILAALPAAVTDAAPAPAPASAVASAVASGAPASPPLIVFYAPADAAATRATLEGTARTRGTAVVDLSPAASPPPAAPQALRRAIEAYHGFAYDDAHTQLQHALAEAARTGALGLSPAELGDAHIYRGLIATEQGDAAVAWDGFVHAATLDPTRRLDPVRFPPRVIETFERAVAAVAAAGQATATVDVDPACTVHLDSRPVQPGDAVPVVPGHHYLRARCPGHAPYGARVLVAGPAQTLRPGLRAAAPPTPATVRPLGRARGADTLLLAVVSPGAAPTLSMRLVHVDTGRVRGSVVVGLAGARAAADVRRAADALIAGMDRTAVIAAPRARPIAPARPTPWYRRPWLWGAAGAAMSAAVLLPFVLDDGGSDGFQVQLGGELPR